jgi:hypothetical protein
MKNMREKNLDRINVINRIGIHSEGKWCDLSSTFPNHLNLINPIQKLPCLMSFMFLLSKFFPKSC